MKMSLPKLSSSTASAIALLPGLAFAAVAQRSLSDDAGTVAFWAAWGAVQVCAVFGYGASSLPKWGGWRDGDTTARLTLIAGVIGSFVAANLAYYFGLYYYRYEQIVCFGSAVGGGFLGEKALSAYFSRALPKIPGSQGEETK